MDSADIVTGIEYAVCDSPMASGASVRNIHLDVSDLAEPYPVLSTTI